MGANKVPEVSRRNVIKAGIASAVAAAATGAEAQSIARSSRHEDLVMVPMRDGVRIAISYWLPEGDGPFPTILMRSLDRRRYVRRLAMLDDLLEAGYAFVSADMRGRFESEGEVDLTYGPASGRDGYDMIEWLAAQPWCDGRIGSYGLSHQAYLQVAQALANPPHLKAMATWTGGFRAASSDRVEGALPPRSGGVPLLSGVLVWMPNEAGETLDKLEAQGHDVSEARRVLRRMRTHPEETFNHLPLNEAPITRYPGVKELFEYQLQRDSRPSGSMSSTPYEQLRLPTFHECGWFDPAAWSQFQGFQGMRERGGSELARNSQHMVAGPWMHAMVFQDRLGDFYFGDESDNDGSGINRLQIKFFDKYVKGEDVDLPRVRYFLMGANEWREETTWPPPRMKRTKLFLGSAGKANSADGDGKLATAPGGSGADHFDYDPQRPVPTLGGSFNGTMNVPGMLPGPLEQTAIECRDDVLVYTTEPFEVDMEMSGPMTARLFVSTSAVDTDFAVKVCQALPDGRSYNIGGGIIRLSGRNIGDEREPVTPGEVYEIVMGLGQTSILLRKGMRLRLQVQSSNFPQFDRNMNTGNPPGTDTKGVIAHQTVWHGGDRASYLEVPIATVEG